MSSKDGEYQTIQNLSSDSVDIVQKISLVKKIALYLKARVPDYMEVDDMVQIGMVGLMEANLQVHCHALVGFHPHHQVSHNPALTLLSDQSESMHLAEVN